MIHILCFLLHVCFFLNHLSENFRALIFVTFISMFSYLLWLSIYIKGSYLKLTIFFSFFNIEYIILNISNIKNTYFCLQAVFIFRLPLTIGALANIIVCIAFTVKSIDLEIIDTCYIFLYIFLMYMQVFLFETISLIRVMHVQFLT